MKPVFLLAERLEHIKNWSRQNGIDLTKQPHIRYAERVEQTLGAGREGYFAVVTWPRNGEALINQLRSRDYTDITNDINNWPLDAFG